jgi:uncharacterized membrane protein (UPF0127 family)
VADSKYMTLSRRLALACAWVVLAGCSGSAGLAPKAQTVHIKGETFTLEVAADDASRERGLKHRTSITDHGGMLFVFPDSKVRVQSFWMHECLIDMDIIFLDGHGTVTALHQMKSQPLRQPDETESQYQQRMSSSGYSSSYPAQFAIELKAGTLDRLNVKVDDRITLDVARLKALAR